MVGYSVKILKPCRARVLSLGCALYTSSYEIASSQSLDVPTQSMANQPTRVRKMAWQISTGCAAISPHRSTVAVILLQSWSLPSCWTYSETPTKYTRQFTGKVFSKESSKTTTNKSLEMRTKKKSPQTKSKHHVSKQAAPQGSCVQHRSTDEITCPSGSLKVKTKVVPGHPHAIARASSLGKQKMRREQYPLYVCPACRPWHKCPTHRPQHPH